MASDASVISTAPPLSGNLRFRLSLMMFLQFFYLGSVVASQFRIVSSDGF